MDSELIRSLLIVAQFVGGGFCFLLWFNYTTLLGRMSKTEENARQLATDLSAYKLHVAETYMTAKAMESVIAKLDRIEDKLDKKQDKP